ncbi:MAG: hypothetical protein CVU16_13520 [Betaproteobacteria bacterium HGW-Betaproteobacteria-10]|nr:MAG: hypothetical protein CVU16_13520 [Betaproteobacteria bacterium HGW-Betaproteobacteria-10]
MRCLALTILLGIRRVLFGALHRFLRLVGARRRFSLSAQLALGRNLGGALLTISLTFWHGLNRPPILVDQLLLFHCPFQRLAFTRQTASLLGCTEMRLTRFTLAASDQKFLETGRFFLGQHLIRRRLPRLTLSLQCRRCVQALLPISQSLRAGTDIVGLRGKT